ncbi:MAG TPA: gliding motility-associated C-terminal domain-containing protein [Chitinophagaceae bacterium]|nr:gliding motility-associated C-terminal domain-containing protein [Chitinophagaceae bacterium]
MYNAISKALFSLAFLLSASLVSAQQSKDVTAQGGKLRVYDKNGSPVNDYPGGESPEKVVDNNTNSKFLIFNWGNHRPVRIQWEPNELAVVDQYTLTSANDAQGRDPSAWTLEGSDDEVTWKVLDSRTGESFGNRFQTNTYSFANTKAYKYYALRIANNAGDGLFQLAEWRLLKREGPPPPDKVKAKAVSQTSIQLTWVNIATNGTGIVIERSLDGTDFDSLTTVGADQTTYLDEGLEEGKGYYYRLLVTSSTVNSDYSLVTGALTKSDKTGLPRPVPTNVVTPNGDNVNDRWTITNLNLYDRHEIRIFDRAGKLVFLSRDYKNEWDGTSEGKALPQGTYYYIIRFWPGVPDQKGTITLIRSNN